MSQKQFFFFFYWNPFPFPSFHPMSSFPLFSYFIIWKLYDWVCFLLLSFFLAIWLDCTRNSKLEIGRQWKVLATMCIFDISCRSSVMLLWNGCKASSLHISCFYPRLCLYNFCSLPLQSLNEFFVSWIQSQTNHFISWPFRWCVTVLLNAGS